MAANLAPITADIQGLLKTGVAAVAALTDAIITGVSADIPRLQGDALIAANTYIESVLPPVAAPVFTMILTAGEAAIPASLDASLQTSLALLDTKAKAFLATL